MQTIWEILLTPNPFWVTVFLSPGIIFEFIFTISISSLILDQRVSRKHILPCFLIFSIYYVPSLFLLSNYVRSILTLVFTFIFILFTFKTSKTKSLIILITIFACWTLSEGMTAMFIKFFIQVDPTNYDYIPIFRILLQLCIYLFATLFYFIFKQFKSKLKILDSFSKKTKILLVFNCIFGILALIPNLIFMINNISNKWTDLYVLFAMLTFFVISIYTIFKSNELESTKQDLENSKLYNKTLSLLIDNLRTFKHDYNNVIQAIGGYISPITNIEGLKKYYSGLVKEAREVSNLTVLNPEVINNPAVFGILANKYYLAKDKNVKITFDIFMDLSNIGMDNYKFTKILGILLDNAIEAAEECEEKIVNISIKCNSNGTKQFITIENTYKNKHIDIGKIYEKSYSTKENNTGIGLWEVKHIVEHNSNLFLDTFKDEKYFKQQLEINSK